MRTVAAIAKPSRTWGSFPRCQRRDQKLTAGCKPAPLPSSCSSSRFQMCAGGSGWASALPWRTNFGNLEAGAYIRRKLPDVPPARPACRTKVRRRNRPTGVLLLRSNPYFYSRKPDDATDHSQANRFPHQGSSKPRSDSTCCNSRRARLSREPTVPSGISSASAISWYDNPSTSRSKKIERN